VKEMKIFVTVQFTLKTDLAAKNIYLVIVISAETGHFLKFKQLRSERF
jgi:hypothetical protein